MKRKLFKRKCIMPFGLMKIEKWCWRNRLILCKIKSYGKKIRSCSTSRQWCKETQIPSLSRIWCVTRLLQATTDKWTTTQTSQITNQQTPTQLASLQSRTFQTSPLKTPTKPTSPTFRTITHHKRFLNKISLLPYHRTISWRTKTWLTPTGSLRNRE